MSIHTVSVVSLLLLVGCSKSATAPSSATRPIASGLKTEINRYPAAARTPHSPAPLGIVGMVPVISSFNLSPKHSSLLRSSQASDLDRFGCGVVIATPTGGYVVTARHVVDISMEKEASILGKDKKPVKTLRLDDCNVHSRIAAGRLGARPNRTALHHVIDLAVLSFDQSEFEIVLLSSQSTHPLIADWQESGKVKALDPVRVWGFSERSNQQPIEMTVSSDPGEYLVFNKCVKAGFSGGLITTTAGAEAPVALVFQAKPQADQTLAIPWSTVSASVMESIEPPEGVTNWTFVESALRQ